MGAAVGASPLGRLMYFPTALVRDQLPVGLDELGGVPTMASTPGATLKARVKKYALAIRRIAKELYLVTGPYCTSTGIRIELY